MHFSKWNLSNSDFCQNQRASRDALFTIGNGYFGVRGFFEEDREGIEGLGGIYMAGVFGKGYKEAATGESRELCNLPNVLRLDITADREQVLPQNTDFLQCLNLKTGVYSHCYIHTCKGQPVLKLCFERFASLCEVDQIWQRATITALQPTELSVFACIDSNVTNLNWESTEPLPIQPGRNHILKREFASDTMKILLDDPDKTELCLLQKIRTLLDGQELQMHERQTDTEIGCGCRVSLKEAQTVVLEKVVQVYRTEKSETALPKSLDYAKALTEHGKAWRNRWQQCNLELDGPERDQCALRYAMFQLMAACPLHTDRVSIGARGLSGEMYEGCVFWDNEIFQLPFFSWTEPLSARRLLHFRRYTLDAALQRAKELWFCGAQYPWQVNAQGEEQTPTNGGGFYAIHITADIIFALSQYVQITKDYTMLVDGGAEMMLQTARFWLSRSDWDLNGNVHIRSVRGPNEYDVFVDDNAYTNTLARQNLLAAADAADWMQQNHPEQWSCLCEQIGITNDELAHMRDTAKALFIPSAENGALILEDAGYNQRRLLDMNKAKPTGKRIIDSTLPYEALPLYQITKQADVVLLMALLPHAFTNNQKRRAYEYYEPRTAHDSSLSYAPHGWLLAQLGESDKAYEYFKKSAFLDVDDRQMNTVSGIHFANFGGTWQMVFGGFLGITQSEGVLYVEPHLPSKWAGFSVRFCFENKKLLVCLNKGVLRCRWLEPCEGAVIQVCLAENNFKLSKEHPEYEVTL